MHAREEAEAPRTNARVSNTVRDRASGAHLENDQRDIDPRRGGRWLASTPGASEGQCPETAANVQTHANELTLPGLSVWVPAGQLVQDGLPVPKLYVFCGHTGSGSTETLHDALTVW